jgi:hypothetical protein
MSTLSVRLPDSLHKRARSLAKEEHISINQLVSTALAEKIAVLDTETYLKDRARRASRQKFLAALDQVPDVEPPEYDRLPDDL